MAFIYFIGHLQATARDYWLQEHSSGLVTRVFLAVVALFFPDLQATTARKTRVRSEEHTSELQSPYDLVCRLLLEKKKKKKKQHQYHNTTTDKQQRKRTIRTQPYRGRLTRHSYPQSKYTLI